MIYFLIHIRCYILFSKYQVFCNIYIYYYILNIFQSILYIIYFTFILFIYILFFEILYIMHLKLYIFYILYILQFCF